MSGHQLISRDYTDVQSLSESEELTGDKFTGIHQPFKQVILHVPSCVATNVWGKTCCGGKMLMPPL